jgi:hypothetical protein
MLALMLLTFLGLTLAATTSTELQIATNYRWSQQALYNAEAGLDAARIGLSELVVREDVKKWGYVLPAIRTAPKTWFLGDPMPAPLEPAAERDFENLTCDTRGGMGYGRVLSVGYDARTLVVGRDGVVGRYLEVSTFAGQRINGSFTVWARRNLLVDAGGRFSDDEKDDGLILVSEGVAPYTKSNNAFARAHQASRVLETTFHLDVLASLCREEPGQEGGTGIGSGYSACTTLYTDKIQQQLGAGFGAANVQSLAAGAVQ